MRSRALTIWAIMTGLLAIWLAPAPAPAQAGQRVALVIGNAAYEREIAALKNPVNDAAAVSATLRRLGFEVISGTDLDEAAFYDRIAAFDSAARDATIALFFYAGHGMQVGGRNYLAPVDLRLETRQDLRRHAIELGAVMEVMRGETNVVILDACRNNPLAGQLARSLGMSRAAAASRGLAPVESARGTLIAYATEPGDVAADGTGDHSPYTAALLQHFETPGLSVNDLFTQVTADVLASTGGKQKPWTHASLSKVVRLVAQADAAPGVRRNEACVREIDLEFWRSVKDSTLAADYESYLATCPQGQFAALARNRLKILRVPEGPPVLQTTPESVEAGLGLNRDDRRLIQLGLTAEGYDPGPVDGLIGRGTRLAIRQWQASRDGAATGFLDVESVKTLLAAGEKRRAEAVARRQAEAERQRREQEAAQRARLERKAEERVQREAAERARREADARARDEADAAARRPIGPKWGVADNQPCQVYNRFMEPGDTFTFTWSGGCVNRRASGEGVFVWEWKEFSGIYKGRMRNGRVNGRGIMYWSGGSRYDGAWRDGLPHGPGFTVAADGRRNSGQWQDGCLWRGNHLVWWIGKTEAECRAR